MVELRRIVSQIVWLCSTRRNKTSPFDDGVQEAAPELELGVQEAAPELELGFGDGVSEVLKAARELGYDLNGEDGQAVWEAVRDVLKHKDRVGARELDAIIASVALQVPPTYQVESYLINSGNNISALAHLKLSHHGRTDEGVALGDGPIDAAFLAVEQIIGQHYELDDFQISTITQNRASMGDALVRLRHNGKIYAGKGISTDIIGASIRAYLNALNKIAYEEKTV
jgi:2-isopropylmalate synthase